MTFDTIDSLTQARLEVKIAPEDKSVASFASDVLEGLSQKPKSIPPKYLYDKMGSELFEKICELPEYYPTRTERGILEGYADEMAEGAVEDMVLAELGSGSSTKTRMLIEAILDRCDHLHYMPIDFSRSILVESAERLLEEFPGLRVTALVSDYYTALAALKKHPATKKMILFLGSSIGNFEISEAVELVQKIRAAMNGEDEALIGIDLKKDPAILEPAYDDAQGVTAAFNLNLLRRINRELDGHFDLNTFRHLAFYNAERGRVEMHLQSEIEQRVPIDRLKKAFFFEKGETIHTENSHKFSIEEIEALGARSDLQLRASWVDDNQWFSLNLFKPQTS